jgi:hypothetical protein
MKDLNFFAHAKAKIHHPAKAPSDGVFFSQKPHKINGLKKNIWKLEIVYYFQILNPKQ